MRCQNPVLTIIVWSFTIFIYQKFIKGKFKYTAYNMVKYGLSLTRIFPYKDSIYDSVLIQENMVQKKPVFYAVTI